MSSLALLYNVYGHNVENITSLTIFIFSWTIFILGLALSYTDTLLVFRLVQIVLLL